jgi:hypothetical protein
MLIKGNKKLIVYFSSCLLLAISAMSVLTYFYWNKGMANIDNVATVLEVGHKIEKFKSAEQLLEVKKDIESVKTRSAITKLGKVIEGVRSIDNIVNEPAEYFKLTKSLNILKKDVNRLISLPEVSSIIGVLRRKVLNFESFVVENRWRTLTRISKRTKVKLSSFNNENNSSYSRLKSLSYSIASDIKLMKKVTTNSVLKQIDQNIIISKLEILEPEVIMLNKILKNVKKFNSNFTSVASDYKKWISKVSPEISYSRLEMEENSKKVLMAMVGIMACLFISFVAGLYIYTRAQSKDDKAVENEVLSIIKNNLVHGKDLAESNYSQQFTEKLYKFRDYFVNRMSMGSVFQNGIPFGTLLLDSNLNLSWGNKQLFEDFGIDKKRANDGPVSWGFFEKYTNLGESDPIIEALNNKVAGIYQIQVRLDKNKEFNPYEMYVSPVEYLNETKILILFYPLRSIEETIQDQAISIIGPIGRTLNALNKNEFDNEFKNKVSEDFHIAGISEIYSKFCQFHETTNIQLRNLLDEIEYQEDGLCDYYKVVEDSKVKLENQNKINTKLKSFLIESKNSIAKMLESRAQIEKHLEESITNTKQMYGVNTILAKNAKESIAIMDENKNAFETMNSKRANLKNIKEVVSQFSSRCRQLSDQMIMHQKSSTSPNERMIQSLERFKIEITTFQNVSKDFNKIVTTLDVALSKSEMIIATPLPFNIGELESNLKEFKLIMDTDSDNLSNSSRDADANQDNLIAGLGNLFTQFKGSQTNLSDSVELLKNVNTEIISKSNDGEIDIVLDDFEAGEDKLNHDPGPANV